MTSRQRFYFVGFLVCGAWLTSLGIPSGRGDSGGGGGPGRHGVPGKDYPFVESSRRCILAEMVPPVNLMVGEESCVFNPAMNWCTQVDGGFCIEDIGSAWNQAECSNMPYEECVRWLQDMPVILYEQFCLEERDWMGGFTGRCLCSTVPIVPQPDPGLVVRDVMVCDSQKE